MYLVLVRSKREFYVFFKDLEEDIKKAGNWKPQMDKYKKQITELQDKMDSETKRSDKSEFETKKLLEKLEAISVERDRLQSERDDLKERFNEANDQLKMMGTHDHPGGPTPRLERLDDDHDNDASMMELIPPAIKERILRYYTRVHFTFSTFCMI